MNIKYWSLVYMQNYYHCHSFQRDNDLIICLTELVYWSCICPNTWHTSTIAHLCCSFYMEYPSPFFILKMYSVIYFQLRWGFVVACRLSCLAACGILVPRPQVEPVSPALEWRFLATGPPGKSPAHYCFSLANFPILCTPAQYHLCKKPFLFFQVFSFFPVFLCCFKDCH